MRWMDVAEYAALQGAQGIKYDSVSPRQAMYALGDAVCVPAVEWLVKNCVLPATGHAVRRDSPSVDALWKCLRKERLDDG